MITKIEITRYIDLLQWVRRLLLVQAAALLLASISLLVASLRG